MASCGLGRLGIRQRPLRDAEVTALPSPPHSPAIAPHPHDVLRPRTPQPSGAGGPVPVPDHGTGGPHSRSWQLPRHTAPPPRPRRLRLLTRVSPARRSQSRALPGAPPPAWPHPSARLSGQWSVSRVARPLPSTSPASKRGRLAPPVCAQPAPRLKRS